MDEEDLKNFLEKFQLTCKKCGSQNVVVSIAEGFWGTTQTGYCNGSLTAGCNDCKKNDFYASI